MALLAKYKKTMPGFSGEMVANAYWKITAITGDKETVTAVTEAFVDGQSVEMKNYGFTPDMDGPNFIKQGYLHLKTLPEFSGAEDV